MGGVVDDLTTRRLDQALADEEYQRQRRNRDARRRLDQEDALASWSPPESTFTVADELLVEDDPVPFTIESLCKQGHNTLLLAQYKVGKTTLLGNVMRALTDGERFLDRFAVRPLAGRVGFWNYELQPDEFRDFLRRLGVRRPERASVLNLRGHRMPLTADHVEQWAVDWLKTREVEVWMPDPWARAMSGNGDENSNSDVTRMTETLDVIKREAGVSDLFVTAHTPRQPMEDGEERARGATRLDDWADARWVYTREGDVRMLRVDGRGVRLGNTELRYDPTGERLTAGTQVSRSQLQVTTRVAEVVQIVTGRPGANGAAVKAAMRTTTNSTQRSEALVQAEALGLIRCEPGRNNSKLWFPVQGGGMAF